LVQVASIEGDEDEDELSEGGDESSNEATDASESEDKQD